MTAPSRRAFDTPENQVLAFAVCAIAEFGARTGWHEAALNQPLSVYIGRENPIGASAGCSLIISRFRSPYSDNSYIGVLGPTRQSYHDVMTLVGRAGQALEETLYV